MNINLGENTADKDSTRSQVKKYDFHLVIISRCSGKHLEAVVWM